MRFVMETTRQLPRDEWQAYFDRLTRNFLGIRELVTIESLSPLLGDQLEADTVRVLSLSFDPINNAFRAVLEEAGHLVFAPKEIWVVERGDGFVSSVELVHPDGTREILTLCHDEQPVLNP